MKRIKHTPLMAALIAVLASSTASADHHAGEREGEFGAFGGFHIFNQNNELGVIDTRDADSLENGFTFGIRAAFALTHLLDVEGSAERAADRGPDLQCSHPLR